MEAKFIYEFLITSIDNPIGVLALMANLKAESNFNPENLQNSYESKLKMNDRQYTDAVDDGTYKNFASDSAGYGLAQWTSSSRKAALFKYAVSCGCSIGHGTMQLMFAVEELMGSYKKVWDNLRNATDLKSATEYVLKYYERPKDQSENAVNYRYGLAISLKEELGLDLKGGATAINNTLPTLKIGSKGTAVMLWQAIIGEKIDGIFGKSTEASTFYFQMQHELKPDGVVGNLTWNEAIKCLGNNSFKYEGGKK